MKKFLEKIKLVRHFETTLPGKTKAEFLRELREKVDEERPGFISDSFDPWTKHRNLFKGNFTEEGVALKYRQRFFDPLTHIPKAQIRLTDNGPSLRVQTRIASLRGPLLATAIAVLLALIALTVLNIRLADHRPDKVLLIMPFVFLIALFCVYLLSRLAGDRLKRKMETHLFKLG